VAAWWGVKAQGAATSDIVYMCGYDNIINWCALRHANQLVSLAK
jgi:hypothetical protein